VNGARWNVLVDPGSGYMSPRCVSPWRAGAGV